MKNLSIFLLLFMWSMTFVSCSDDENGIELTQEEQLQEDILGEWQQLWRVLVGTNDTSTQGLECIEFGYSYVKDCDLIDIAPFRIEDDRIILLKIENGDTTDLPEYYEFPELTDSTMLSLYSYSSNAYYSFFISN